MNDAEIVTQSDTNRRWTLGCVIPAMVVPLSAALLYYVLWAGTRAAMVVYTATKAFTLLWPIFVAFVIEDSRFERRRPDWKKHWAALPLGVATGLLIAASIVGMYALTPLGNYARAFADEAATKASDMRIGEPVRYVTFAVFLAALHSLIEEFFWRWYVFGRLIKVVPRSAAYFLASLAFAGHHYVVLACCFSATGTLVFGTCVGIGGGLWCWMYRRQSTLAGSWISHALVDAAILYIGYKLIFA